jgi:hypothetical protein
LDQLIYSHLGSLLWLLISLSIPLCGLSFGFGSADLFPSVVSPLTLDQLIYIPIRFCVS